MNQKVEFIESYIKIGNGDYKWNDNHGELVRCKDCIYFGKKDKCIVQKYLSEHPEKVWLLSLQSDWFCADGKREDEQ